MYGEKGFLFRIVNCESLKLILDSLFAFFSIQAIKICGWDFIFFNVKLTSHLKTLIFGKIPRNLT